MQTTYDAAHHVPWNLGLHATKTYSQVHSYMNEGLHTQPYVIHLGLHSPDSNFPVERLAPRDYKNAQLQYGVLHIGLATLCSNFCLLCYSLIIPYNLIPLCSSD